MSLTQRPLSKRMLAGAMAAVLAVGISPITAMARTPIMPASTGDVTEAVDITNTSKSIDGAIRVADGSFAAKARGEGVGGVAALKVGGDVVNTSANEDRSVFGVVAYGFDGGNSSINVGGSVNVTPAGNPAKAETACGIFAKAASGNAVIEVANDVSTTGVGDAIGIKAEGDLDASISMKVNGSISTASSSKEDKQYDAFSVDTQAMSGAEVSLEVNGNVSAKAEGSRRSSGGGVIISSGASEGESAGKNTVVVHGSVDATGVEMAAGAKVSSFGGSHSQLTVDGDIVSTGGSDGAGAWLESMNGATAELVVQGTVRGEATGLMFDGSGETNFDTTVWKVEVGEGGSLFKKGSYAEGVPDDVSSQVNYIMKVEQPEKGGTIRVVGPDKTELAKSHGFDVARAGDKVYLDAALEPGYYLRGAYNGDGERTALSHDEGGYYITVPEGGGVYLTADIARGAMNIVDGMAQPVFAYSDVNAPGYSNANSELYRFVVYVETDYDTDLDGKCDLVKAYVQVPRAAVEGGYQAPVLFQADPYSAGMRGSFDNFKFAASSVDDKALMGKPAHRTPSAAIATKDLALDAELTKASDWNYQIDEMDYPSGITSLDYYLVRGFAVVQAAGLGTYGSEGIECCGTVMERDAFVDVVEWLHGTKGRRAYADAAGTTEVKATDWSSGHVGMTGLSYPGGMCFEVATSGVEGLDTVVPVAGVASWYDITNSQGICTSSNTSYNYTTVLADTCASRLFENAETGLVPDPNLLDLYQRFRTYMRDGQAQLQGDYGPYWAARDWVTGQTGIRASALIVTGLNDTNVTTKHFDLMRNAFIASGCEVKTLLHQSEHVYPADSSDYSDIMIGKHSYLEWINLWFTRALVGVDNEASALPNFTVQSNVDGSFYGSDRWNSKDTVVLRPAEKGETTVQAKGAPLSIDLSSDLNGKGNKNAALWTLPALKQFTIAGKIPVRVRAKVDDVSDGDIPMCVALLDVADKPFNAFSVNGSVGHEVVTKGDENSRSYNIVRWTQEKTTKKLVSVGHIDLRNPEAGYEPSTATKRAKPIKANTYYNYTIWLDPTYYTVQPGHRLELYVVPFLDYLVESDIAIRDHRLQKIGLDASALMNIRTDYSFTIDNAKSYAKLPLTSAWKTVGISKAKVAKVADKTYTGKAQKPSPKLTYKGKKLKKGRDYTLSYKNNVKAGTAKLVIKGKGAFSGTRTVKFTIKKAAIKSAKAAKLKARSYTGKAQKPNPKLTFKGKKLKKGRDYKLTYKNNKKRGVAKVIVTGKGNFKGKKVLKFRIK